MQATRLCSIGHGNSQLVPPIRGQRLGRMKAGGCRRRGEQAESDGGEIKGIEAAQEEGRVHTHLSRGFVMMDLKSEYTTNNQQMLMEVQDQEETSFFPAEFRGLTSDFVAVLIH